MRSEDTGAFSTEAACFATPPDSASPPHATSAAPATATMTAVAKECMCFLGCIPAANLFRTYGAGCEGGCLPEKLGHRTLEEMKESEFERRFLDFVYRTELAITP